MEKDIGKITKSEYQGTLTEIVIGLREYNDKTGIDIREFTTSEQYTGPTKKGLRVPANKFEEFRTLINSIDLTDLKPKPIVIETKDEPAEIDSEEAGIDDNGFM